MKKKSYNMLANKHLMMILILIKWLQWKKGTIFLNKWNFKLL